MSEFEQDLKQMLAIAVSEYQGAADPEQVLDASTGPQLVIEAATQGRWRLNRRLMFATAAILFVVAAVIAGNRLGSNEEFDVATQTADAVVEPEEAGLPTAITQVDWNGAFLRQEEGSDIYACLNGGESEPVACRPVFKISEVGPLSSFPDAIKTSNSWTLYDVRIRGVVGPDGTLAVDDLDVGDETINTAFRVRCDGEPAENEDRPARQLLRASRDAALVEDSILVTGGTARMTVVTMTTGQHEAICDLGYDVVIKVLATSS